MKKLHSIKLMKRTCNLVRVSVLLISIIMPRKQEAQFPEIIIYIENVHINHIILP